MTAALGAIHRGTFMHLITTASLSTAN